MLQLRAAAGSLWWRRSACLRERAVTAVLIVTIAGAWIVLAVMAAGAVAGRGGEGSASGMAGMPGMAAMRGMAGMPGMARMRGMAGMPGMSGMSATDGMSGMVGIAAGAHPGGAAHHEVLMGGGGVAAALGMWTLMIVAMMLPSVLPAVRHVAINTLRRRRGRAMAAFASVYVLIWVVFGAILLAVSPAWSGLDRAAVATGALALAAGWQLTAPKRRALRDCHRPSPLPPTGPRATAGVIRFALRNGTACVRSCWAMMLAMAVATTATTFWMVAIAGFVVCEKLATRPRQTTRAGAVALTAGTLVMAATALIS